MLINYIRDHVIDYSKIICIYYMSIYSIDYATGHGSNDMIPNITPAIFYAMDYANTSLSLEMIIISIIDTWCKFRG